MSIKTQTPLSNPASAPNFVSSFMDGPTTQSLPQTPVLFQNFGVSTPTPDIYEGDAKKWEEHFRTIKRAYKEFGKEADFAIRVLTEDFTLPFPYAWPPDDGQSHKKSYFNPTDRENFDFFMHPGKPVPQILQPLHATTKAYFKKRQLERPSLNTTPMAIPLVKKTKLVHVPTNEVGPNGQHGFFLIAGKTSFALSSPNAAAGPFLLQDTKGTRIPQTSSTTAPCLYAAPQENL